MSGENLSANKRYVGHKRKIFHQSDNDYFNNFRSKIPPTPFKQSAKNCNFLRYFFSATFLLCLSPFRICINKADERFSNKRPIFVIKSWFPQKIICAILTLLGCFWILRELRTSIPTKGKNPTQHFNFVSQAFHSILKLITIKQFWCRKESILKIVQFISNVETDWIGLSPVKQHSKSWRSHLLATVLPIALISLYAGIAFINWVIGPGISVFAVSSDNIVKDEWSIDLWWMGMIRDSRFNFFLPSPGNSKIAEISQFDYVLAALTSLGYLQRRIFGMYTDLFIVLAVMGFYQTTSAFKQSLDDCKSWSKIHEYFKILKRLSNLMNGLFGSNVALLATFVMAFFPVTLDALITQRNAWKLASILFYYCNYVATFLISAAAANQVACQISYFYLINKNKNQINIIKI